MRYHLAIKEEASNEVSDAFTWYEDQKEGLGSEFITELEKYFDLITQKPLLYPISEGQHVAIMDRFPYKIVYELEDHLIVVFAVFHTSRNPKKREV